MKNTPLSLLNRTYLIGLAALVLPVPALFAQAVKFTGSSVAGGVQQLGTVNLTQIAKTAPSADTTFTSASTSAVAPEGRTMPDLRPSVKNAGQKVVSPVPSSPRAPTAPTTSTPAFRGFNGLSHLDQRLARSGNQFSVEPPDQALAVGNGLILEGVNCAINVYDINGNQLLNRPVALTELFLLPPAINRATGVFGPAFPGDVVALFDPETSRWFVEAWTQLSKSDGTPLRQSRIYLAVSQTSDPTGAYTIYTFNSTDAKDPDRAGPRVPDYAKIGFDHYGFYISCNEFAILSDGSLDGFIDVAIYAISKQALVSGATNPAVTRIGLPFNTGYEFTLLPAYASPGVSPLLGGGGVELFVSSPFVTNTENSLAVWALLNTSSLNSTPSLGLQMAVVNTLSFNYPSQAVVQKDGFHPLADSVGESLETLDPGDFRALSVSFTGSEVWMTLGTEVTDQNGDQRMAAAYFDLTPKLSSGTLSAKVKAQGVVALTGASLLRPAIAINAQGNGGMVFTLVGPNDYPSSAFVPFTGTTPGAIQIARAGNEPEDGFSGYMAFGGGGTSRWGDYSFSGVDADGSILMATEYTPDNARTSLANWSTYIARLQE